MWTRVLLANAVTAGILATAVTPDSGELKPATLAAFDRYVRLTEARIAPEVAGSAPFLWIDRQPQHRQADLRARLGRGEVVSERLQTRDGKKEIDVDDGMIHHWVGTVLLRGAPLAATRTFVRGYDRYASLFMPMIVKSEVLESSADRFRVRMRTSMTKVITVVIDADYHIDYRTLSKTRLYTKSVTSDMFEVKDAGQAGETRIPGDRSSGFLWRLNTYCSFEETKDGTIEQCESVSLTRGVPFGFGWLIGPMVEGIPRDTLAFTLGKVQSELQKR